MANKKNSCNGKNRNNKPYRDNKKDSKEIRGSKMYYPNELIHNTNEIAWYAASPQQLESRASFPFAEQIGKPYSMGFGGSNSSSNAFPGIARIGFIPTIGGCATVGDAPNVFSRNMYNFVRAANSGSTNNYTHTDLTMMIMAISQPHILLAKCMRAYGVMRYYSNENRYLGQHLLRSMGFSSNFYYNTEQFRGLICDMAAKLRSFSIPDTLPIFARQRWLASHVWMDTDKDGAKCQLYFYDPDYLLKFEEMDQNGKIAGHLNLSLVPEFNTPDEVWNYFLELVDALELQQEFYTMQGDVLKAYGNDHILKTPMIDRDYTVSPEYNELALNQWHHTTMWGTPHDVYLNDTSPVAWIGQDVTTNLLYSYPAFDPVSVPLKAKDKLRDLSLLIDAHMATTPEYVMEVTRNMVVVDEKQLTVEGQTFEAWDASRCGSEIFTHMTVRYFSGNGAMTVSTFHTFEVCAGDDSAVVGNKSDTELGVFNTLDKMALLQCFKRAPIIYPVYNKTTTGQELIVIGHPFTDVAQYTVINPNDLNNLHTTALQQEFALPILGLYHL